MLDDIYSKVLDAILQEMSTMAGGAVGGVATPLGSGPKAGSRGERIYKKSTATDKKHRSKGKKKKTKTKSVQWYLKNGSSRSVKESRFNQNKLLEARTSRIKDFKKSEIISFLEYLKGKASEEITFSTTEKIAGQSMTIGIKGTPRGNTIYSATKEALDASGGDIFNSRFIRSRGTSGTVRRSFIKKFRRLEVGEKIELGMEIVTSDYKKPDYIAYHVPRGKQYAAIFSIKPEGSFTKADANTVSSRFFDRRTNTAKELKVLMPEDIPLTPEVNISEEVTKEIDDIIEVVNQAPIGRSGDPDSPVKSYINREVSPRIRNLVKILFPSSNINPESPIEGIAVNMTAGDNTSFFKVPNEDFNALQSIQASVYAEFKLNRSSNNFIRAQNFIDQLKNPTSSQSFARNVFKLVKYLNNINNIPLNYRTFFSPEKFRLFCTNLRLGLENSDINLIKESIDLFSKRLYTSRGNENFRSEESEALVQFIDQNSLL